MRVRFAVVRKHFADVDNVDAAELYKWIGYPENIGNPNFENTCAIRLSLALLGAGFPNPGTYPVKAGRYNGRMIETGQRKLSNFLVRQLGQPEKFKNGAEALKAIDSRHGIISFFQLHGPSLTASGHIAIVAKDLEGEIRCGRDIEGRFNGCYWGSVEVWFWPLP